MDYNPKGCKELDTTEVTEHAQAPHTHTHTHTKVPTQTRSMEGHTLGQQRLEEENLEGEQSVYVGETLEGWELGWGQHRTWEAPLRAAGLVQQAGKGR